jgi:hypothetical protein
MEQQSNDPQQPSQGLPQQQPYYPPNSYASSQPPQFQPTMIAPPQPPKQKHTGRNLAIGCGSAIVLLLLIIIIAAISTSGHNANTGTAVTTTNQTTTSATQASSASTQSSTFAVGQTVSVGGLWQIVVTDAKTSTGSQYNTPQKSGDVFLVVAIAVKNISGQSQDMSSDLQWSLTDTTGQKYDIGIDPDAGATLDGSVAANAPFKGVITFEVPKTIHNFVLAFQPDITSSDQTLWNITV